MQEHAKESWGSVVGHGLALLLAFLLAMAIIVTCSNSDATGTSDPEFPPVHGR